MKLFCPRKFVFLTHHKCGWHATLAKRNVTWEGNCSLLESSVLTVAGSTGLRQNHVAFAESSSNIPESEFDQDEEDLLPNILDHFEGEYHPYGIVLDSLEPEPLPDETLHPTTDTATILPTPEALQKLRRDRFDPDELEYGEWEVVSPEGMKEENEYYYSGLFEEEYSSDEEGFDEDLKADPSSHVLESHGLYADSLFANAKLEKALREIEMEAMTPDWDADKEEDVDTPSYSAEYWGTGFGKLMGSGEDDYADEYAFDSDGSGLEEAWEEGWEEEEEEEWEEEEEPSPRQQKEEKLWLGDMADEIYAGLKAARRRSRKEGIPNSLLDLSEEEFEDMYQDELPADSMAKLDVWLKKQDNKDDQQETFRCET
jgi:hypothetical protein